MFSVTDDWWDGVKEVQPSYVGLQRVVDEETFWVNCNSFVFLGKKMRVFNWQQQIQF